MNLRTPPPLTNSELRELERIDQGFAGLVGAREDLSSVVHIYRTAHEWGIIDTPEPNHVTHDEVAHFCVQLHDADASFFFAKVMLGYDLLEDQPHRNEVAPFLTDPHPRKALYVPRGAYKTTYAGIGENVRRLVADPAHRRILYSMVTLGKAIGVSAEARGKLESPAITHFFGPQRGSVWGDSFIVAGAGKRKDLSWMLTSPDSSAVGQHVTDLTIDDLYDLDGHLTPSWLYRAQQHIRLLWPIVDEEGATTTAIMTRWHQFDAFYVIEELNKALPESRKFKFMVRRSDWTDAEGNFHSWFPRKYTPDHLVDQLAALQLDQFEKQFHMVVRPGVDVAFDMEYDDPWEELPAVARMVISGDPNNSKKHERDLTAVNLQLMDPQEVRYLVDGELDRCNVPSKRVGLVVRIVERHPKFLLGGQVNWEGYGFQSGDLEPMKKALLKLHAKLVREGVISGPFGVRFVSIDQSNNDGAKYDRIGNMEPTWSAGGLRLPKSGKVVRYSEALSQQVDIGDFTREAMKVFPGLMAHTGQTDWLDSLQMGGVDVRPPLVEQSAKPIDRYEDPLAAGNERPSDPIARRMTTLIQG